MQRFCTNCGHPVGEHDVFCSECGAQLEPVDGTTPAPVENQANQAPAPAPVVPTTVTPAPQQGGVNLSLDTSDMGAMAALAGAVLVVISAFVKVVSAPLGISFTFMDLSKGVGLVLILAALMGAYGVLSKVRCLAVGAGTGLFITFVGFFIQYERIISELKKGFFGAMAAQAIGLSAGMYLLLIGCVLLTGGAVVSYLKTKQPAINAADILNGWKDNLMAEFHVGTIPLHAWILTVAVPVLVFVAVSQSDVMKGLMH